MGFTITNFILGLPLLIIEVLINILVSLVREWFDAWYKLVSSILGLPFSNMEKIKNFFKTKPCVTDGEKVTKLYDIPVYLRSDGVTIKLGAFVTRKDIDASTKINTFNVKRIAVQADLGKTCVIILPTECVGSNQDKGEKQGDNKVVEEITIDANDVTPLKEKGVCPVTARNGMDLVSRSAATYPHHIQKFVRKHQVSSTMRKQIQSFLSGFSMSGSCSLGCINWQLDPIIFGLERDNNFCIEYRVENSVNKVTQMDLLMGHLWDARSISSADGFRIILDMELVVDSHQELFLKMHGTLISSKIEPTGLCGLSNKADAKLDPTGLYSLNNKVDDKLDPTGLYSLNNKVDDKLDPTGLYSLNDRDGSKLDPTGIYSLSYRAMCLKDSSSLHMVSYRRPSDITSNRTRRLSDITNNASAAHITPGQTLAWDEFQTQSVSAGNSPWRGQCGASGGVPSVTVSGEELFASGGSLSGFPTSSTNAMQTLEKLLSALPQSQIVFNSPIKEVSGEYSDLSSLHQSGPNTSTPADDLDGTASGQGITPHSSPSLHGHKHAPERLDKDDEFKRLDISDAEKDEELVSLQLQLDTSDTDKDEDNNQPERVTLLPSEQVLEFEPTVPMRNLDTVTLTPATTPRDEPTDPEDHTYSKKEKEVDSLKLGPNIKKDFQESTAPAKSGTKDIKVNSNLPTNSNLDTMTPETTPDIPDTPDLGDEKCFEKNDEGDFEERKVDSLKNNGTFISVKLDPTGLYSLKPRPSINTDLKESIGTEDHKVQLNSNLVANSNLDSVTMTPATTPDIPDTPDRDYEVRYDKNVQGGTLKLEAFEEKEGDSLEPSPDISIDFEDSSTSSKSETEDLGHLEPNLFASCNPMSRAKNTKTSLNRVRDYVQSLPSPKHQSKRGDFNTDSFPLDLKTNLSMTEEGDNSSQCSGTQSRISRQSDMSSKTGARMGTGMFYGLGAGPTVCSFPDEWNHIIPESIENDEEID